ncbi:nectin-1-like isoform X4 [Stegostoma tigrinum]|nr:nectin-1-like isoform X4 [Stegostoma tigrinum]
MAGTEVLLPCWPTANNTNITQFSWTKDGQEKPVVVYNLKYGPSVPSENYSGRIEMSNQPLLDGSIRIKALKIQDEGNYTCEITLFPQGAEKKGIHLTILVIPTNAASSIPAEAGLSDAPVAQCTSAFGNPAAEITWKSSLPGKHTMIHVVNDNNMVTVHSNYTMTPHRSNNGQTVTCQVTHSATSNKTEYPVQLSILYRPVVTITGYDGTWSVNTHNVTVTCSTDANPEPTNYTWRGLPEGVEIKNAQVFIGEESALENGNWTCEAANTVGIGVGRVEVVLGSSNSSGHTYIVLTISCVVVALLIVAPVALLIVLQIKKQRNSAEEVYINIPNQRKKIEQESPEINATYTSVNLGEQSVYSDLKRPIGIAK